MEIKSNNDFNGLYATKKYIQYINIYKLVGEVVNKPTRTSIEIDDNQHIEDKYGIYMNHSFNPNCKIQDGHIFSIKNINIGDELTFNYNDNETDMAYPFIDNITQQKVTGISTQINQSSENN
jgi:hypothetical protein